MPSFASAEEMAHDLEDLLFEEKIRPSVSALGAAVVERRGRLGRAVAPPIDVRAALGLGPRDGEGDEG